MRIVLLGAPGVGKGVQGNLLKEKYKIPRISTGDILREAIVQKTREGKEAEAYLRSGKLVPDSLINSIVEKRLQNNDCKNGFVLDGYPRTIPQAEFLSVILLKNGKNLYKVISIDVNEDVIIRRLSNRRICLSCGEVYNMLTDPPPEDGKCRVCRGQVVLRDDDKPETIKKRLEVYNKETQPLKEYYVKNGIFAEVDGDNNVRDIHDKIITLLE
jgi:adenylate kinase